MRDKKERGQEEMVWRKMATLCASEEVCSGRPLCHGSRRESAVEAGNGVGSRGVLTANDGPLD